MTEELSKQEFDKLITIADRRLNEGMDTATDNLVLALDAQQVLSNEFGKLESLANIRTNVEQAILALRSGAKPKEVHDQVESAYNSAKSLTKMLDKNDLKGGTGFALANLGSYLRTAIHKLR